MVVYYNPFTIFFIILYLFYIAFGGGGGVKFKLVSPPPDKRLDPALGGESEDGKCGTKTNAQLQRMY